MNKERMLALASAIESHPEHFDLRDWFAAKNRDKQLDLEAALMKSYDRRSPECGTVACVAGWAVVMFGGDRMWGQWHYRARDLLELTSEQAEQLFYGMHDFEGRHDVPDHDTSAAATVAKIRRMVAEEGA